MQACPDRPLGEAVRRRSFNDGAGQALQRRSVQLAARPPPGSHDAFALAALTRCWPCNSNSVCLGPCHLPRPEARSTDFGLSAGILAAGPVQPVYSSKNSFPKGPLALLTPWRACSPRRHPEARGDERRTPALRSGARPRRAPPALRTRSSEERPRTTRAARAVAAECRASGALAPPAGVYDQARSPPTGGSGGAARSARRASLRASRPPSATACSSPTASIHASTTASSGFL
jgi:hypothetical protein